jgi:hypothetical protein
MDTEQYPTGKGRRSPVVSILIISLVLGGAIFLLNRVITASAASSDYVLMLGTYPNIAGSRIDSCSLCHTSAPNLNPYGAAYKALGRGNASSFHMIEALDSDGDGYTNIQEINALTFPGNAADFPQTPTNTPTAIPPTATPTNTSVPPTATNTSVPPTPTDSAYPAPPTPTNAAYPPPPTATSVPTTEPTAAPTSEPTGVPTTEPTVAPTEIPVGATMQATLTEEVEETEKPEETERPEKTKQPEETKRPEKTKVMVTRTPRPTKTLSPSRTPRATRVYPTRQATPTMVCVRDDDSNAQAGSNSAGSVADGRGIRCPRGYHILGQYASDYTNYGLKPFYTFYSRRSR